MASQATKRRSKSRNNSKASSRSNGSNRKGKTQRSRSTKSKQTNGSDPRPASQKTEKYRFAKNVEGLGTAAEREYQHYAEMDPWELDDELPDVLLDVPVVKLDSLHFELENLDATGNGQFAQGGKILFAHLVQVAYPAFRPEDEFIVVHQ